MHHARRLPLLLLLLALLPGCAWFRPRPPSYPWQDLADGLRVRELVVPEQGAGARAGDRVGVHYALWIWHGPEVESSRDRGQPLEFTLGAGKMPQGLERGMLGMRRFGKRRILVPPELAYGSAGRPPQIPPDATLLFDVELMELEAGPAPPPEP